MLMLFGKGRGKKSKEITVVLACSARVKFNGRRRGDLERNFNGGEKGSVAGRKRLLDPGSMSCDHGRVTAKTNRRYTVTDFSQ